MHTEQCQVKLGSNERSLSLCLRTTSHGQTTAEIKAHRYKETAVEKSILIIFFTGKVYFYILPGARGKAALLQEQAMRYIAVGQQVSF